jgi:hypothetical protein
LEKQLNNHENNRAHPAIKESTLISRLSRTLLALAFFSIIIGSPASRADKFRQYFTEKQKLLSKIQKYDSFSDALMIGSPELQNLEARFRSLIGETKKDGTRSKGSLILSDMGKALCVDAIRYSCVDADKACEEALVTNRSILDHWKYPKTLAEFLVSNQRVVDLLCDHDVGGLESAVLPAKNIGHFDEVHVSLLTRAQSIGTAPNQIVILARKNDRIYVGTKWILISEAYWQKCVDGVGSLDEACIKQLAQSNPIVAAPLAHATEKLLQYLLKKW